MLALLFALLVSRADIVLPLNPEYRIQLKWIERFEKNQDFSGPLLSAQAGISPQFNPCISATLQASTASATGDKGPLSTQLTQTGRSNSLTFSRAAIETHVGNSILWSAKIGKYKSDRPYSPLLWDEELNPEGLGQSLDFEIADRWHMTLFAEQNSLDQKPESLIDGTPQRRSWLLVNGALLTWTKDWQIGMGISHYYFHDLSEGIANIAATRGNTVQGVGSVLAAFDEQFSSSEILLSAEANPLGIRSALHSAFVVNWQTDDWERGFYIDAEMGNIWRAKNFHFRLSYYYSEPDSTMALVTDHRFGGTNRKGPQGEISYFFIDQMRMGLSVSYFETLRASTVQATRKEISADLEVLF